MNFSLILILMVLYFSGLMIYLWKCSHLLMMLLMLEYMVIIIYSMYYMAMSHTSFLFSLFYLTLTVCEGSLGLSILVSMSRTHGGDYLLMLNLMD